MKKRTIVIPFLLFILTYSQAQRPWQKLNYPTIKEVAANFLMTPPENSLTLWWGWDGPVSESIITSDLDKIKSFGYNAVMIEAGYGMAQPYLSDGWFELVKFAVGQAKIRGMRVWIEDEGKYPSGFAGGKFSAERPDLRMQALLPFSTIQLRGGETLNQKFNPDIISAVATDKMGNIEIVPIINNEINWTAPSGEWKVVTVRHLFKTSVTRSVNNPSKGKDTTASLFDYLNPEGTRQFIVWTHEQYKKHLGDEFGKTFMGIMGDEPDFSYTPWTPKIPDEFIKRKGYDIRPYLAAFFLKTDNDSIKRIKADFWDVWSDLFKENFFDVQAEWCRQNNIDYIVHLNHEEKAMALVKSEGDYFKCMRNVGIPGVDAIWGQIWMDHVANYPKLASSAAHLFGKPHAFTESFAAYTYKPSVAQAKWVMDYQLVRGINQVQNMFWSSSAGRPKINTSDTLKKPETNTIRKSYFTNDSFPKVARYISRSSYLLSQGLPAAQIAVYYPTTSFWLGNQESDNSVLAIARELLEQQRDFDFIDEQSLISFPLDNKEGLKNLSGQCYHTVIIPSITVISKSALEKLRAFADNGGKVIFMGSIPLISNDRSFLHPNEISGFSSAIIESTGNFTEKVISALPEPDVKLERREPDIKYVHRKLANAELYFFFNEGTRDIIVSTTLSGKGKIEEWDALNGKISIVNSEKAPSSELQTITLNLNAWETKFILISR
jgi:hypothetical protein